MGQCLTALVLVAAPPGATAANVQGAPWRVLVLDATDSTQSYIGSLNAAVRDAMAAAASRPIEFYTEYLDAQRFQGELYESEFVTFVSQKYSQRQPDVVVTVLPGALEFAERHRSELWPAASIVFVGVPDDLALGRTPVRRTTGVLDHVDFEGTLRLALQLQPDTRRVAVVSGASPLDRMWKTRAADALRVFAGRLEVDYLDSLPIGDLLSAVAHLPKGTIVLHTSVFRDGRGEIFDPPDVTRQVAAAASVPVYGTFEPAMGTGIVGLSVVPLEAQARRAGELAVGLLRGQAVEFAAVEPSLPARPQVDWRALQRFGIPERRLPPDAVVSYRAASLWTQYRAQILGGLVVLLLESALIVMLLIERRDRRRAELESQRRNAELAHASRLAAVGEITASIAHQVNQPLGAILSNADAAEMLLDANPGAIDELRHILADIRRDDVRASEVVHGMRALLQRRDVDIRAVDLNDAIADILRLVEGEARRRDVAIDTSLAVDLPPVAGDRVHLQQVVLNLVLNAMEAIGSDGGAITIRTGRSAVGEVEVAVEDNGPGIAPDRLPAIFDSFFTTKTEGMGLGLSIARSIVEAHGGRIDARNRERGAMFTFVLPCGMGV